MIDRVWNWFLKKDRETDGALLFGLAIGFVFGLGSGLVDGFFDGPAFGLGNGIGFGIVFGLVSGFVNGLFFGLVGGIVFGLGTILALNFVSAITTPPELLLFLVLTIILTEILFWLEKNKPSKKESKYWFTLKRKIINATIISIILSQLHGLLLNVSKAIIWIEKNYYTISEIIQVISQYSLIAIAVIGIIIAYIWLNSLKYKKKKKLI